MTKENIARLFVVFLMLGLPLSVSSSYAQTTGDSLVNTDDLKVTDIRRSSWLERFIDSFAIVTDAGTYSPGQYVSATATNLAVTGDCPGNAQAIIEIYNVDKSQQSDSSLVTTNYGDNYIGPVDAFDYWTATFYYRLPSNAKIGTWSAAGWLFCPTFGTAPVAKQYSSIYKTNFNVAQITCTSNSQCGSATTSGNYCSGGNVVRDAISPSCKFAGTTSSYCWDDSTTSTVQTCTSGCSNGACVVPTPLPSAINGECKLVNNGCTAGTLLDTQDLQTSYSWQCIGSNGGTTASCSLTKSGTYIDGACGTSSDSCISGTSAQYIGSADTVDAHRWQCIGSNGGTTASCSVSLSGTSSLTQFANPTGLQINSITTQTAQGKVYGSVALTNNGLNLLGSRVGIVEMQVIPATATFSLLSGEFQNTCEATRPNNVNYNVFLKQGQTLLYQLISPNSGAVPDVLPAGQYKVGYFFATQCQTEGFPGANRILSGFNSLGPFAVSTITIDPEDEAVVPDPVNIIPGTPGTGISGSCTSSSECSTGNYCIDGRCQFADLTIDAAVKQKEQEIAEQKAKEDALKSSCPNIYQAANTGVCIPADCPYLDSDVPTAGFTSIFGNTKVTSFCCSGLKKMEQTSKDFSLKWLGAGAGALTTAIAAPPGGIKYELSMLSVGGVLGYFIGGKLYSSSTSQGICQESSGFGGLDSLCKLNFLKPWFPDCAAGLVVETVGIFALFKFL